MDSLAARLAQNPGRRSHLVQHDVRRESGLRSGRNSYLVKPVGTDAFVDLLKTIELYWIVTNERPGLE